MNTDRFKFRGRILNTNEYVYGGMFVNEMGQMYILQMSSELIEQETNSWDIVEKRYEVSELEQCTGLKDKNGNLIFEGDRIYWKEYENNSVIGYHSKEHIGAIMWYKKEWRIQENPTKTPIAIKIKALNDLEIIGNIHEEG